tara:strand:+ start:35 stop:703 length:669 start_codon:yes stop_codon:yes gene_type:complete
MANPAILQSIIKLAQRLGANPQKFIGSRTNIKFLGSGPSNELFSKSIMINDLPRLFQAGGKLKPQILSKVESGVGYATAGKLSNSQLTTLNAQLKAMDNLKSSLTKPTGIVNTESFRSLGRRRARGSEFKEMGQRLKAQRTQGFKEAMEAADDLILEGSGGTITRTDLKNLSPEALQNLRLEFAPDIMARFFKPKLAGGGMVGLTDDIEAPGSAGLANILAV